MTIVYPEFSCISVSPACKRLCGHCTGRRGLRDFGSAGFGVSAAYSSAAAPVSPAGALVPPCAESLLLNPRGAPGGPAFNLLLVAYAQEIT